MSCKMKSLLLLTAGALLAFPLLAGAQTSSNETPSGPPPDGGEHHGPPMNFLTPDQKAEYMKDRDAALAADPTLAAKIQSIHEQMKSSHDSGEPPSEDLMNQMKAAQDQLDQEMIKADPAVAPIIDEIKKHHHHRPPGGQGGPGGGSSTGSNTPPAPADGGN
jgi:Spy/CpxP family protein refolding chaperone